jgi:hypothetical protein
MKRRSNDSRFLKVQYGRYDHRPSLPHPVIRFGADYLGTFGFEIGDTVEVKFETG